MSNDTVFTFGGNAPHTNARQKDKTVTGGKGANLAEMASIGLPVPPGFTIATEECLTYLAGGSDFTAKLRSDVAAALNHVEKTAPSPQMIDVVIRLYPDGKLSSSAPTLL